MRTRTTVAWGVAAALAVAAVAAGQTTGLGSAPVVLKVGDPAPPFTLPATDGRTYSLAGLRGRTVVLAWFPKAFTRGCTLECKSFADHGDEIKQFENLDYFMISVDPLAINERFATEHGGGKFPILSDPGKRVAEAYGVLSPAGVANRWTFYIGPDGKIVEIDRGVKPPTAAQDVVARLDALGVPRR